MMKKMMLVGLLLAFGLTALVGRADEISSARMRSVYETVKTPYKYGMVLTPEVGEMFDSPSVFRHGKVWYMMFIRFDGKGYETHLAKSDDLLSWKRLGRILVRGAKAQWDALPGKMNPRGGMCF